MRSIIAAALLAAAPLSAHATSHNESARKATLAAAVDGPLRSSANRARDTYRHPGQTLAFFGLKPGMTVVEIWPSGGWYSEILAPAIGPTGKLYAAHFPPSERTQASIDKFKAKLASDPAYGNTEIVAFGQNGLAQVPAGSADMVLTFRNVHNWMGGGWAPQAFQAFYAALKPGGVLGIEEHRLPEGRTQDPKAESGYVKQSAVIAMAEAAGFKLDARSEINANRRDKADYAKGVWTLPPNFAEGDKDRARYTAIGESDRMTLRFRKPA